MLNYLILSLALLLTPLYGLAAEIPDPLPASQSQVNINTATAEQLASRMKGVGLSKAKAIVAYREENGPFTELAQLTQVKGIGEKTLERNAGRLQL
ncbi:ComEA family DNA-binding protein [Ferrimonas sediminicola]|nr:ComEA family DNA-binding protein [Ferrimonas sediminicola]